MAFERGAMKTNGLGKFFQPGAGRIQNNPPKRPRSLTEVERERLAQANMMIALQNVIAGIVVLLVLGAAIYGILLIAL